MTLIRPITDRHSLPPASLTPSSASTPLRVTFHVRVETMGLTTFRTSTNPGGVRLRLCAGGTTSARNEIRAPLPGHMPFGSSLSASLACQLLRRLHSGSLTLAIPSNPSSRPPRGWQSQRRLAVRPPAFTGRGYIVPGAPHPEVTPSARPGRVPVAEHRIVPDKYSCDLVSHAISGHSSIAGQRLLNTECGHPEAISRSAGGDLTWLFVLVH